jgi:DNA-binding transcriptional ArsR family regulator
LTEFGPPDIVNHMVYYAPTVDRVFAAVSSPTRRDILDQLRGGERPISELARRFDMSLPAVSKHVRVLQKAGLLRVRRSGRTRWCRLQPAPLRAGDEWLARFRNFWHVELDQVQRYVEG